VLTLGRAAALPPLVAAYFGGPAWAPACTGLFVASAATDWLDGYLARKLDASTPFGAFLDPVVDKLLVATSLILVCSQPPPGPAVAVPWLLPACAVVVIGREIAMSALREWTAREGLSGATAVNSLGKWKTASQMTGLALLLWARHPPGAPGLAAAQALGPALVVLAAALTGLSLALYFRAAWAALSSSP